MEKTVLNLSKTVLTKDQMSVLSKGLNFCPTPGESIQGEQRSDSDSLHNRLRLKSQFSDDGEDLTLQNEDTQFQSDDCT